MQFNGEANNNDLCSDIDFWCGTTDDNYSLEDKARNANLALDQIVALIFRADQKWQWDDNNETDLPIALGDLISGQEDYAIPVSYLKIHRLRIKDRQGEWRTLDPMDRKEVPDTILGQSGDPKIYSKIGTSIFLGPTPDYASTGGFEIQFQRGASYFTPADTTKAPGFASHLHRLVSLYAARDKCIVDGLDKRLARIEAAIEKKEAELLDFYSTRNVDQKQSLSLRKENYGDALSPGARSHPKRFF